MADKKKTAAEKKAAEEAAAQEEQERKGTERKRLIGAGAILAAIALFAGGYAVGNANEEPDVVASDVVVQDEFEPPILDRDRRFPPGPRERFDIPEYFPRGPGFDGDRPGRRFEFDLPEFPDDFPRGGFGFGMHCTEDGHCTFTFPEDFEFPEDFPRGPYFDDGDGQNDTAPEIGEPGFLGLAVSEDGDLLIIEEVFPGSPAEEAGIEPGDLIVAVDGDDVDSVDDLVDLVSDAGSGTEVEVTVDRDGVEFTFDVELSTRPS